MKVVRETEKVLLYRNKEDDLLITLKLFNVNSKLTQGQTCDLCGKHTTEFYLPPELCHHAICSSCFKDYSKRAKWYIEDISQTFNTLIAYVCLNDIVLEEGELQLVNDYLNEHSHREHLDIHKFMNYK